MATTTPATPPPAPRASRDRSGRRRALLVGLVLVLLVGAVVLAGRLVRVTDAGHETLRPAGTVQVTGDALELTLTEGDVDEINVTWTTRRSPWLQAGFSVEEIGDAVGVFVDCPTPVIGVCSTRATVVVPRGSLEALDVDIAAGAIAVTGTRAEVRATTRAGRISLTGYDGPRAELRADAGRIEVDATTAPTELDVLVGTGDVRVLLPDADYDLVATTRVGTASTAVREVAGAPHTVRVAVEVGDVDVASR